MKVRPKDLAKVRGAILQAQGYQCPLCLSPLRVTGTKKRPVVDHNHTTGYIRMVLCVNCNGKEGKVFNAARAAAGKGNDPMDWLHRMLAYHDNHKHPHWGNATRKGLIYPTFKSKDEKRLAALAKAKRKRQATKLLLESFNDDP